MNSGPARQRITFNTKTATTGTSGQDVHSTGSTFTRWAQVKSIKGRLDDQGIQQTEGRRYYLIKTRYDAAITYSCSITYRGREMSIERIDNVREVNHELVIYAYEVDL